MTLYRQGDVLLVRIAGIPANRQLTKRAEVTVAEGEVTGHHHVIEAPAEGANVDADFVRIMGANGLLTHPEHATLTLPPGDYRRVRQREYAPEANHWVYD